MKPPSGASDKLEAGFTLIEVLVAFAIAALMLVVLYRITSTGLRSASAATRYSGAVLVAESTLEVFSAADLLAETEMHGRIDGYSRDVRVWVRHDLLPDNGPLPRVLPYEIDVTVSWRDGIQSRSVALSSLRLGPAR